MRISTLGEVADWGSGGTPKRGVTEFFGDGTPWLSIADLNDGIVSESKESLTDAGIANSSAKIVPAGTIFIAMYGSIGKLGIAGRQMCTSQAIAFANPRKEVVDRRYLFHYLLAQRRSLQSIGRGGTQMNIGQGDLKAWPIPLPELSAQRRIAAFLDHADALRAKRQQVLTALDRLPASLFHSLAVDVDREVEFGGVILDGPTNGLYRPSSDYGSGTPILRIDGFDNGKIHAREWKRVRVSQSEMARYELSVGDIIVNRVNALSHLGKSALIESLPEPSIFESNMMRIRLDPDQVVPRFAASWLRTSSVKQQVLSKAKQAVNQASINQRDVRSLKMPLPSLRKQRDFAAQVQILNAHSASVQTACAVDDELFAALQFRAFRGEL